IHLLALKNFEGCKQTIKEGFNSCTSELEFLHNPKFDFYQNETNEIKKWIFHSMGTKCRVWKGSLKARVYDPSLTVDEIVAHHVKNDNRVNTTQFKELSIKRLSRSKMKEP
ncbi:hypothetical protein M8C21_006662, partial [Ambrosia artemisiifolia]